MSAQTPPGVSPEVEGANDMGMPEQPVGTPPKEILDIFEQHIMGEQAMHQGGQKVPVKGIGSPSKKPIGGITAPRNVNPNKLTGGEGVGNV
jgi:hypothetical protein